MSIGLIILILAAALAAQIRNKTRGAKKLLAVAMVITIAIGNGFLPQIALNGLQKRQRLKKPEWGERNAIVLLGAGATRSPWSGEVSSNMLAYSRLHEAARLYLLCKKQGKSCTIFLTGGDPAHFNVSEAQLMTANFIDLGVPENELVQEKQSNNTFQNAQFTAPLLKEHHIDKVFLVTSGVHMNRSLAYFNHFGVDATPSIADEVRTHPTLIPTATNFVFFEAAVHEYLGLWRYQIYNVLGWNPASQKPGAV